MKLRKRQLTFLPGSIRHAVTRAFFETRQSLRSFWCSALCISLLRAARLVLLFGFQNELMGLCVLVLILSAPFPVWSLRWWTKYTSLTSDDEDFQGARTTVKSTGSTALAFTVASGALLCLVLILKFAH